MHHSTSLEFHIFVSMQDFRERGGYSRDVIDVLDDSSGKMVKALLYRGTPDNPAFWRRALFDLSFAAGKIKIWKSSMYFIILSFFYFMKEHHCMLLPTSVP